MAVSDNQTRLLFITPRMAMWFLVGLCGFIGWVLAMLAVVMKGSWLVLLAPGAMCACVAIDFYKQLQGSDEAGR